MSDHTNIEWCDSTFNPWIGCTKVSPACDHCYAERLDGRGIFGGAHWGPGVPRKRTSAENWRKPAQWNSKPFCECMSCGWRGEKIATLQAHNPDGFYPPVSVASACPECGEPTLKAARRRVFCASLADMLDNESELEWFVDALDLWRFCGNIDWLVLTKRIGNLRPRLREALVFAKASGRTELAAWIEGWLAGHPPTNVWIGATICNQQEADRDIPKLLAVPAAVRFLSIEPMLGAVDLTPAFLPCRNAEDTIMDPSTGAHECCSECDYTGIGNEMGVDWIIAGGESGPQARPAHPDWFRCLRDHCKDAGVPFLFKQWGEWAPVGQIADDETAFQRVGREVSRGDYRNYHQSQDQQEFARIGKSVAGRLLDGVTHNGFPEASEC